MGEVFAAQPQVLAALGRGLPARTAFTWQDARCTRVFDLSLSPLGQDGAAEPGCLMALRDITELQHTQELLREPAELS